MICTLYSHKPGFNLITDSLQKIFPSGSISLAQQDEFQLAHLTLKGGLFSSTKKLKIAYRERKEPSWFLPDDSDCPLVLNLRGMYGLVSSIPSSDETIKELLLQKITTLNCEFSIIVEQGEIKELKKLVQELAAYFHAVLFVQPGTVISRADGQHFLDEHLDLILDSDGRCETKELNIEISSAYYDSPDGEISKDQLQRKEKSELLVHQYAIPVNSHLPCIESLDETRLRGAEEIAQRVTVLALVNLVAFDEISPEDATGILQKNNCLEYLTPAEKEFLANPTDEKRNRETWKCEGIWTLLWAINKVDELYFPDRLCNLNDVDPANYPIGREKNPADFIRSVTSTRSKEEIMDAADLYYRLDWACVNARLKNVPLEQVHPGVVYERHYTLNWLINYMGQEWDDITCDT